MTASKAAAAKRVVPLQNFGAPAGRLLELQLETNLPQPYVVTDKITVAPPTKERADRINEAQMVIMIYSQLLNDAMARNVGEEELNGLTKQIREAETRYNEAYFGDAHEDVVAFFKTQPIALWNAFKKDIQAKFFPNQPVDGKCPTCGHVVDEEAVGKELSASASSNTGGTS